MPWDAVVSLGPWIPRWPEVQGVQALELLALAGSKWLNQETMFEIRGMDWVGIRWN